MRFVDDTSYSAILTSTVIDEERIAASIVARVAYAIAGERLVEAPEQPWRASREAWDSPRGRVEADLPFMRGGVDLFLFGSARAPKGIPVASMEVSLAVGDFCRRAKVSGRRIWIYRDGKTLSPSAAAPFVELPLTLANAFGGEVEWDGLKLPWAENPKGKGFCIEEARAEGADLPNLEEPDSPMKSWDDRPPICGFGFCPMASVARFRNSVVLTPENEIKDFSPALFNTAYPPMIAPKASPGDTVRAEGVLHEGPLVFVLPEPPFEVRLRFGDRVADRTPFIDQIGIEVDERRVFLSYRFPYRYVVRPREIREAIAARRKVG